MSFDLPSLHLATTFDRPTSALALPGVAGRGEAPSFVLADGAVRGAHRLARLVRQEALIGLHTAHRDGPLRVTLTLLVDAHGTRLWRLAHELDETAHPHETPWHRFVRVSVDGRPRAAVLLDLRPADDGTCLQRVSFGLRPEEIGAGGLLLLTFDVPDSLPAWLGTGLLEDGLTGVCVARVRVEPLRGPVVATLSTGRPSGDARTLSARRPGGFVVNPGDSAQPVRIGVLPRALASRAAPVGRRARLQEPAARLRDRTLALGLSSSALVTTEITRLDDSSTRLVESVRRADGSAVIEIDPSEGPVACRPRLVGARVPAGQAADWWSWVE